MKDHLQNIEQFVKAYKENGNLEVTLKAIKLEMKDYALEMVGGNAEDLGDGISTVIVTTVNQTKEEIRERIRSS